MSAPFRDYTAASLGAAMLERARLTLGVPAAAVILTIGASLLMETRWTSNASFVPETRNMPALNPAILGLASQFGVSLGGQAAQSPQFYAEVLRSREILEDVLETRFAVPGADGDSATLLDLLRVRGRTPEKRLEAGVRRLNDRLKVSVNIRTSIVSFGVETPDPRLSHAVAARLLSLLNEFNLQRRQSQARERRRFAEQRTAAADSALRVAENRMRDFYLTNRRWEESPTLTFEEARLRRELTLRQELQLTLARELETARIEEVNDTPVITVIDPPDIPQRKSRPKRRTLAILALVVGAVAGGAAAIGTKVWKDGIAAGHPDYIVVRDTARRLVSSVRFSG